MHEHDWRFSNFECNGGRRGLLTRLRGGESHIQFCGAGIKLHRFGIDSADIGKSGRMR